MIDQEFAEVNKLDSFLWFLLNIEWKDPWIIALFTFHISIFMMAILTRNYGNFQALLFFCLLLLVYFSESINKLASTNWNIFSRQQLFDSNGLFISVVFSMPILLNCILMVGSWMYQSTQLMKNLKLAQLREQRRIEKEIKLQNKAKEE
ncbi:transmembrane protein 18 isoform X1 [Leptinotarsa decemlineata]|uniref:transmembrane protein 18 isoform X1 n=1 Tax=Leptinotarsa decemlineata TaxID=7539 RepID=UPI003D304562